MDSQRSLDSLHRYELQDRYIELTRTELPGEARKCKWVVREDHCFMRIILDRLFSDCWYNHLDRRLTAYKQLNNQQLQRCIIMAEQILGGDTVALAEWNRDSLRWRGKLK